MSLLEGNVATAGSSDLSAQGSGSNTSEERNASTDAARPHRSGSGTNILGGKSKFLGQMFGRRDRDRKEAGQGSQPSPGEAPAAEMTQPPARTASGSQETKAIVSVRPRTQVLYCRFAVVCIYSRTSSRNLRRAMFNLLMAQVPGHLEISQVHAFTPVQCIYGFGLQCW